MKKLMLIRHAKSDWSHAGLSDYDRPLNERGKKNAPEMALRLKEKGIVPRHLVSSGANRAESTARIFMETLGIDDLQLDERIYAASDYDLLNVVNSLPDTIDFAAIFGHNPTITELVNQLANETLDNVPTCGVALIDFDVESWAEVSGGLGKLVFFDYPKNGQD